MNSLVRNKQEKEAIALFNRIKTPTIRIYYSMIDLYRKLNNPEKSIAYFTLMINDGIYPTLPILNAIIDTFAKNGDQVNAILWFNMIIHYELIPDSYSYTSIINMYTKFVIADQTEFYIPNVS